MALNSIGNFVFLKLEGNPVGATENVSVQIRPGLDGFELWKEGNRGRPFPLLSIVDQVGMSIAQTTMASYRTLVGGNAVPLYWADEFFGNVNVLDVQQFDLFKVAAASGGFAIPSGAVLVAQWTLLVV